MARGLRSSLLEGVLSVLGSSTRSPCETLCPEDSAGAVVSKAVGGEHFLGGVPATLDSTLAGAVGRWLSGRENINSDVEIRDGGQA